MRLRAGVEDFVVDEVPLYEPSGEGEHLYLRLEKRERSTPAVVRALCQRFGLKERDVGYAGRKDERGVTRQWVSVPASKVEPRADELEALDGVRVLESGRHKNKLRLGHLRGNRFTLVLRGELDVTELRERARSLAAGFPNAFGVQRFGHDDVTLRQAERWLEKGRRAKTRKEKFWVSAVQSSLFNALLAARIDEELWDRVLDGDVLQKGGARGPHFVCDDPAAEGERVKSGEVTPTGPMWGLKMRPADRAALTFESRSLKAEGVNEELLLAHPSFAVGTRRPLRAHAEEVSVEPWTGGARVSFTLPAGSYATIFVEELVGQRLVDEAFSDGAAHTRA